MSIINNVINRMTNDFTDTIIYKESNELVLKVKAIEELLLKYPDNEDLLEMLKKYKYGLNGEKQIDFELKNSNIGMYILHDINLKYKDLKAQIDCIVITPAKMYVIECKNLNGNIKIDNKGNFIIGYYKKKQEGFYSPVSQAQRHIEILKKIWMENHTGILDRRLWIKSFEEWCKPLVVLTNKNNIIDDRYAPKEIKKMVIRVDNLVHYIKTDINKISKELLLTQKEMEQNAYRLMRDYNRYMQKDYKTEIEETIIKNKIKKEQGDSVTPKKIIEIRNKLLEFRKKKAEGRKKEKFQ